MKMTKIQKIYLFKKFKTSRKNGYSINEMVIVLAIIGILASILVPSFRPAVEFIEVLMAEKYLLKAAQECKIGLINGELSPVYSFPENEISLGFFNENKFSFSYTGVVGPKTRQDYVVMGTETNMAARLMGKARDGGILCSERVYNSTKDHVGYDMTEPVELKGRDGALRALRPYGKKIGAIRHKSQDGLASSVFVGRKKEMTILRTALKNMRENGQGSAFILEGLAGMGKSAIVWKLQKDALEEPISYPEIQDGKDDEWNQLKDEYDKLLKTVGNEEIDISLSEKQRNKLKTIKIINKAHNKRRNYHAAVVSAKKHINDCIIYAKTPLPINELNASSENNTLNIEKLKICYKNFENIEINNFAISTKNSDKLTFFYAKEDAPHYQVCSSDINHVRRYYPKSKLETFSVKSITINDYFENHSIYEVDYLSIDIEGFDYEVLMSIDFNSFNIKNISIEYLHLTKTQKKKLINYLIKKGYSYSGFGFDHNNFDYLYNNKIYTLIILRI